MGQKIHRCLVPRPGESQNPGLLILARVKNKNTNENIILINDDLYNDISPMLDLLYITSDPESYEYKNDFNYENSSSLIIKFSNLMNNL